MFDFEFFPTPKSIISRMVRPYKDIHNLTILEPSAGRGAILDYLKDNNHHYKLKLYCCEIDKDLQYQLAEKNYKIISEDFLQYTGDHYFDLILMNPPFSKGADHLLKAWEVLHEGDICCLLNAETIKNPHTEKRKLLAKIIEQNGTVEYLGDCFKMAENKTDVEVALIRLKKKATGNRLNFTFEQVTNEKEIKLDEHTFNNPLAVRDVIGNMILQYDKLKENFVEYLRIMEGLKFYAQGLLPERKSIFEIIKSITGSNQKERYNDFSDKMKMEIWEVIIDKMGMERYMTYQVRQNFAKFIETQGAMDFTKENVSNLIKTLLLNGQSILQNAITDVFDIFTKYHDENRVYVEGWKTNSKWKVNKRIILPNYVDCSWGNQYQENYHHRNEYSDIDRVMCYITGKRYEDFTEPIKEYAYDVKDCDKEFKMKSIQQAIRQTRVGDSSLQESEFFFLRSYKKGTLHLEFKDKDLWQEFNMRACSGKRWLPEAEEKEWRESKGNTNSEYQFKKVG